MVVLLLVCRLMSSVTSRVSRWFYIIFLHDGRGVVLSSVVGVCLVCRLLPINAFQTAVNIPYIPQSRFTS